MQELAPLARCFVLDMHRVDGMSEIAARFLNQARIGFAEEGIAVVFSRIQHRGEITLPLRKAVAKGDRGFLSFEDNDLAGESGAKTSCSGSAPAGRCAGALADAGCSATSTQTSCARSRP